MSYARFSSDDWLSDVYVYECENGDQPSDWVTHVAGNRIADEVAYRASLPEPVELPDVSKLPDVGANQAVQAWFERHNRVRKLEERAERESIDLPFARATLRDTTPGACADRLESLRALGYRVPQRAIDRLRAEQEELSGDASA